MILPVSTDEWLRYQLGALPLTGALLAVIITALLIMARHRRKGIYLLIGGALGMSMNNSEPHFGSYMLSLLTDHGMPFDRAMLVYNLISNTIYAAAFLFMLLAALHKRNESRAPHDPAFAILPPIPPPPLAQPAPRFPSEDAK